MQVETNNGDDLSNNKNIETIEGADTTTPIPDINVESPANEDENLNVIQKEEENDFVKISHDIDETAKDEEESSHDDRESHASEHDPKSEEIEAEFFDDRDESREKEESSEDEMEADSRRGIRLVQEAHDLDIDAMMIEESGQQQQQRHDSHSSEEESTSSSSDSSDDPHSAEVFSAFVRNPNGASKSGDPSSSEESDGEIEEEELSGLGGYRPPQARAHAFLAVSPVPFQRELEDEDLDEEIGGEEFATRGRREERNNDGKDGSDEDASLENDSHY
jgi:hypothetical protein